MALHVLLHMASRPQPVTSEALSACMGANPVVVRRALAGLRREGLVRSEKGHGGGWRVARALERVSLLDVYEALGSPALFHQQLRTPPGCLVAKTAGRTMEAAFGEAAALLERRFASIRLSTLAGEFRRGMKSHRHP